jgi:hypothetical protein
VIPHPDSPPAVVVRLDEGAEGAYTATRQAGLINGPQEADTLGAETFGQLTITSTPGIADTFVQRPAWLINNIRDSDEGSQ